MADLCLTLVHSCARGIDPPRQPSVGSLSDLDRCDPSESLLDVLINGRSIIEIGSTLCDPARVLDLYVIQRLSLGSRWNIAMPLHRLADTLTDATAFTFAEDLARRGYEDVTSDSIKNSIKRLRQVFGLVAPSLSRNWFIRYLGPRGYIIDWEHVDLKVVHLPQ